VDVERSAPAVAAAEAEIAADPQTVWDVLTAFESWPSWNPGATSVSLQGGVAEGAVFRWKAGRATITSTLRKVEPPRFVGWTGKTAGIKAVHVWHIDPVAGGTRVRTEESWEGFLVRVLRGRMKKDLQSALDDGLTHLKAEAERRASLSA
jgi:uncharacterized protein YndB with AHSA1/START domain